MKSLISFFIKYSTWATVIKIFVLIFGLIALFNIKTSFFPELEPNIININIVFPAASPEEIEEGVIQKIEDNLKGVKGIDRVTSVARENTGSITVEVFRSYNTDEVLDDVKNAVDRINSFPAGLEPVVVSKSNGAEFAISFAIYGTEDLYALKNVAKRVENDIRTIPGISQLSITGYPAEEIVAFVKEAELRRYQIKFDDISRAIRNANIEISAGSIKTDNEELLIRIQQKNYYAEKLQDIVIKSTPDGKIVTLKDVADIRNTWSENPQKTFVNGKRAVVFTVQKVFGENILEITDNIKQYIDNFNKRNDIYKAEVLDDFTFILKQRINTLLSNGIQGAILVVLSLAIFLNIRLAFWVALSIPFSFMGTFLLAYLFGITINAVSLFGSIIVVGILVDDGIVISEQAFQKHEEGMKPFRAALEGTIQVLPSVVFAVLTTVVMFLPFFFMDGRQGANMRDMAFIVIVSLLFSLLEAALLLPSHLAHSNALVPNSKVSKLRIWLDNLLLYPRDVLYMKTVNFFINHKPLAIGVVIFVTVITIGGLGSGIIRATFFPFVDGDSFNVVVTMQSGTRENITEAVLDRIEKAAWEVNEELKKQRADGKDVILRVVKNVGVGDFTLRGPLATGILASSSNEGNVQIVLLNGEERNFEAFKISNMIREKVEPIYGAENVVYGGGSFFGKPVSISLISQNFEELEFVKEKIKEGLRNMPDIGDVTDNDPSGLREIRISLKENAYLLGLTNLEVARQIRQGFFGDEIQRLQRGDEEIKVWTKYNIEDRSNLAKLEDMRIRLQNGSEIPLREIADYKIERGRIVINHIDGKRQITIEAELKDLNQDVPPVLAKINDEILEPLLAKYPSVSVVESGQKREIFKFGRSARTGLSIAFVVMFLLIVLSFRSWMQAFVVISLLPMGIIAAIWGHYIQNMPVSTFSAFGLIALIGIFVNNAIVLINTMNDYLKKGKDFMDSLMSSAKNRFRPILLTTITTALGLLPLLAERSLQAQFLIPMAISVAYGLLLGSFFILVLLPVYLIFLNDFRRFVYWLRYGVKPTREEVETAVIEEKNIVKYMN